MYEDDGKTNGALENGQNEILYFTSENGNGFTTFRLTKGGGNYKNMPVEREMEFILHNFQKAPALVKMDGKKLVFQWDKTLKQLRFHLKWKMTDSVIEVKY